MELRFPSAFTRIGSRLANLESVLSFGWCMETLFQCCQANGPAGWVTVAWGNEVRRGGEEMRGMFCAIITAAATDTATATW